MESDYDDYAIDHLVAKIHNHASQKNPKALQRICEQYVFEVKALACLPRDPGLDNSIDLHDPPSLRGLNTEKSFDDFHNWIEFIDPKGLFSLKKHQASLGCALVEEMEELKVPDYEELFGELINAIQLEEILLAQELVEICAIGPKYDVFGDVIFN